MVCKQHSNSFDRKTRVEKKIQHYEFVVPVGVTVSSEIEGKLYEIINNKDK